MESRALKRRARKHEDQQLGVFAEYLLDTVLAQQKRVLAVQTQTTQIPESEIADMVQMHKQGVSYGNIALQKHWAHSTVARVCRLYMQEHDIL